jgi:hypothetical protein
MELGDSGAAERLECAGAWLSDMEVSHEIHCVHGVRVGAG